MSDELNLVELVADKAIEDRSFLEKVSDRIVGIFSKAVWTTAFVNNLPDSAFLHILPGGEKDSEGKTTPRDLRMFPYKDADGKIDLPHLRNAIARIPQSNRIDDSAKASLQARARKLLQGESKEDSSVGFFKDSSGNWWFLGVYSNRFEDRDKEILSEASHLDYVDWLKETGFKPIITAHHQPKMKGNFWVDVFSKYENVPITLKAIVDNVYKETAFAEVERVFYVNGFTIVSAKVLQGKEAVAERLSAISDLGMSHGFIVKDSDGNIINKYRSFEMSVLRRKRAANYITMSLFRNDDMSDNTKGLSTEDRQFLSAVYGEEVAAKMEEGTKKLEEMMTEAGLDYKEITEHMAAKKPVNVDDGDPEDQQDNGADEATEDQTGKPKKKEETTVEAPVAATVEDVIKALKMDELNVALKGMAEALVSLQAAMESQAKEIEGLKAVAKDVEEMKKDDDERIAAQITPSFNWSALGFSNSKSAANVVDKKKKEELQKNAPKGTNEDTKGDAFKEFFLPSVVKK